MSFSDHHPATNIRALLVLLPCSKTIKSFNLQKYLPSGGVEAYRKRLDHVLQLLTDGILTVPTQGVWLCKTVLMQLEGEPDVLIHLLIEMLQAPGSSAVAADLPVAKQGEVAQFDAALPHRTLSNCCRSVDDGLAPAKALPSLQSSTAAATSC